MDQRHTSGGDRHLLSFTKERRLRSRKCDTEIATIAKWTPTEMLIAPLPLAEFRLKFLSLATRPLRLCARAAGGRTSGTSFICKTNKRESIPAYARTHSDTPAL